MTAMDNIPAHVSPTYSEESCEDALFHYTTGTGLLGILRSNELWSTAYYCTNDESELKAGSGVLTPLFRSETAKLIRNEDLRVRLFSSRGVRALDYAEMFESTLFEFALSVLCVYMTCFCRATQKESFTHGLLSQWRGYGVDAGYALQFSKKLLQKQIEKANADHELNYALQEVHYSSKNALRDEVLQHSEEFIRSYSEHLDMLAQPIGDLMNMKFKNPVGKLTKGPLESFLDYLIHTKSEHFREEDEYRLSVLQPTSGTGKLPIDHFDRNGLLVPFVRTPKGFNVLECIDWIIVGPCPRIVNRYTSVKNMVKQMGLDIQVRPSHIPFSRA
jgi:hypothetical protein